jgi:hypothetical protein
LNPFHPIVAAVLALLVASPVCCCATERPTDNDPHSCCEAGKGHSKVPDQAPHRCACRSKEPKNAHDGLQVPAAVELPLPPETTDLRHFAPAAPVTVVRATASRSGCDPPRNLLSRIARWRL